MTYITEQLIESKNRNDEVKILIHIFILKFCMSLNKLKKILIYRKDDYIHFKFLKLF